MWVESVYFTTTTITTIGFGDYKAFNADGDVHDTGLMIYMYFVTLFGIILFSSVTREIFNYHSLQNVEEIVKQKVQDMERFLYEVSARRDNLHLSLELISDCKNNMTQFVKSSTRFYFAKNNFYKELPQTLKKKIVNWVLSKQYKSFMFFLEDFESGHKASQAFIIVLLTNLDSQMYKPGTVILNEGDQVEDLILIRKGNCNLYGFKQCMTDPTLREKVLIVKLS